MIQDSTDNFLPNFAGYVIASSINDMVINPRTNVAGSIDANITAKNKIKKIIMTAKETIINRSFVNR